MRVIKVDKKRGNIVLSRKAVLEEENSETQARHPRDPRGGPRRRGSVKNITDYGAFVDLGGIDGLLHITDMSWGRINHPSELVKVGDEIKVASSSSTARPSASRSACKQLQGRSLGARRRRSTRPAAASRARS